MDLIVTERGRTYSAFLCGEEYTDYGTSITSLESLLAYIREARQRESRQVVVRPEGDSIVADLVNGIGVVILQLSVDHNLSDRDHLIAELKRVAQGEAGE